MDDENFEDTMLSILCNGDYDCKDILMHREAHFGGLFSIMIDYYSDESNVGCSLDFDVQDIKSLADMEVSNKKNLAIQLFDKEDWEKIGRIRKMYHQLRELCEQDNCSDIFPKLIARLILAEEDFPKDDIDDIVKCGKPILNYLIKLLKNEEFRDPLFPGYGRAPALAAKCLEKIGGTKAIASIYEAIRLDNEDNFDFIKALCNMKEQSTEFLLSLLKGKPICNENKKAAFILEEFDEDGNIAKNALEELNYVIVNDIDDIGYISSLVSLCRGLKSQPDKKKLLSIKDNAKNHIAQEICRIYNMLGIV